MLIFADKRLIQGSKKSVPDLDRPRNPVKMNGPRGGGGKGEVIMSGADLITPAVHAG